MTNREENRLAALIAVYFKDIGDNQSPEASANAGITLVRMLMEDFPNVADKADDALEDDWDAMVHLIKLRKGQV